MLQGEREMAQYNKTLGRFQLAGIAPAPRGIPQIEVTFDIDRNGIVNVSAKDLGTGNEQKVTITASSNLSEDDIKKAVREAEQFAEEDKRNKENAEVRNHADGLLSATEKTMKEMGDKISDADKARLNAEMESVRNAMGAAEIDNLKNAVEKLTEVSYDVFGRVYQQTAAEQQAQGEQPQGAGSDAGFEDADFEVMDDDNKN